jgi:cyclase
VEHYRLEQVSDGAWAAVVRGAGEAVANSGIVRCGDATIVFDTSMSLAAARELRFAAERIAPVAAVVNSHWHDDHVSGNPVFADVEIVATERTRELMTRSGSTPPATVFLEQIVAGGVQVETLGGGHTESDAFLWFEDTLFAGDLVVVGSHPWVGHGDTEHWIEILEAFEARGPRQIVPGHGPVGSHADLAPLRRYLEALLEGSAEPVAGWGFTEGHSRNVEALSVR